MILHCCTAPHLLDRLQARQGPSTRQGHPGWGSDRPAGGCRPAGRKHLLHQHLIATHEGGGTTLVAPAWVPCEQQAQARAYPPPPRAPVPGHEASGFVVQHTIPGWQPPQVTALAMATAACTLPVPWRLPVSPAQRHPGRCPCPSCHATQLACCTTWLVMRHTPTVQPRHLLPLVSRRTLLAGTLPSPRPAHTPLPPRPPPFPPPTSRHPRSCLCRGKHNQGSSHCMALFAEAKQESDA